MVGGWGVSFRARRVGGVIGFERYGGGRGGMEEKGRLGWDLPLKPGVAGCGFGWRWLVTAGGCAFFVS